MARRFIYSENIDTSAPDFRPAIVLTPAVFHIKGPDGEPVLSEVGITVWWPESVLPWSGYTINEAYDGDKMAVSGKASPPAYGMAPVLVDHYAEAKGILDLVIMEMKKKNSLLFLAGFDIDGTLATLQNHLDWTPPDDSIVIDMRAVCQLRNGPKGTSTLRAAMKTRGLPCEKLDVSSTATVAWSASHLFESLYNEDVKTE